jgi:hypothetical protein
MVTDDAMTPHPDTNETDAVKQLVGYETSDADAGPVVRFALFLLIVTLSTAGLVTLFYKYLDAREAVAKARHYPMSEMVRRPLPPRPRLQTYPFTDITALRADERRLLDGYAWVDKNAGVVRIPIDRAIDVLAERGLPHRAAPPNAMPAPAGVAPMEPSASPPSRRPAANEEQQGEHH